MAGVLMTLLGMGSEGLRIDLPMSYSSWGDKYSAGEQYGADTGLSSGLGTTFTPPLWKDRPIRAIMHLYDYYAANSRTMISLYGYDSTPAPKRLRIGGTTFLLGFGGRTWSTIQTGITFSGSPTNNINWSGHGLAVGEPVQFYCTGGMPSGLVANTVYYVHSIVSVNAFKITATPGGAVSVFSGSGSGTRYGYKDAVCHYDCWGSTSGNVFGAMLPRNATISIATPAVITSSNHGLVNGDRVQFTTSGSLPAGIVANTTYFVVNAVTNTFNISLSQGGPAIASYGSQSGTHVIREVVTVTVS